VRYFKVVDNYHRLNQKNEKLKQENERMAASNERLKDENTVLREQNRDYALLRKVFGSQQVEDMVVRAKESRGWER